MQILASEWEKWDRLNDREKSVITLQELGWAFIRQKQRAETLQGHAQTTIQVKITKWELQIREDWESGNSIVRDKLETLLAQDMCGLFPDLLGDVDDVEDIDIDGSFGADGQE